MPILKKDSLALIMIGATHTVRINDANAYIYYPSESEAHMLLPDGKRLAGTWNMLDDGYTIEWKDGPAGNWKLDHRPGQIDYLDGAGIARGTLTRIDFGDSAALAG